MSQRYPKLAWSIHVTFRGTEIFFFCKIMVNSSPGSKCKNRFRYLARGRYKQVKVGYFILGLVQVLLQTVSLQSFLRITRSFRLSLLCHVFSSILNSLNRFWKCKNLYYDELLSTFIVRQSTICTTIQNKNDLKHNRLILKLITLKSVKKRALNQF